MGEHLRKRMLLAQPHSSYLEHRESSEGYGAWYHKVHMLMLTGEAEHTLKEQRLLGKCMWIMVGADMCERQRCRQRVSW